MAYKYTKHVVLGRKADGTLIRKRVYANSKADLDRKVADAINDYKTIKNPSNITFKKYSEKWLTAYKSTKEIQTVKMYKYALKKTEAIDYMRINQVKQTDLQLLIQQNKTHPSACKKLFLTLNQIFKCAVKDGIININPAEGLELPQIPQTQQRALKPKEKKALKNLNLDPMDNMYVYLLYYFGIRPQEALGLMIQDFEDGYVTIRRAVGFDGNHPYIKHTKTNNVRRIPIPDVFKPDVSLYLKLIKTQNSLYLMHRNGRLITKSVQVKMWGRIKKRINVLLGGNDQLDLTDSLHPYTFRHDYCTRCYYAGISILKCQELMGHSSSAMVMRVYTHLDNSKEPIKKLLQMSL